MKEKLKTKEESKNKIKEQNIKKKRFKPIIKENIRKGSPYSYRGMPEHKSYEAYYVQNIQKNIENLFEKEYPNYGMNQITNKLIGSMLENEKKKEERRKEKEREEEMFYNSYYSAHTSPRFMKKIFKKANSLNRKKSIVNNKKVNKNANQKEIINNKKPINFSVLSQNAIKTNINSLDNNALILPTDKNNLENSPECFSPKQLVDLNLSPTNFKIFNFSPRKTANLTFHNSPFFSLNIKSQKEELNKKISFTKIKDKSIISNKKEQNIRKKNMFLKLRKIRKINPNFRDELLSERLFKHNFSGSNLKNENIFDRTQLKLNRKLPLFDKIIFKKGETEKLLNYQFYNSSYRSSCETKKEDGIDNLPIKTNYKNNWKMVKHFVELNNNDKNKKSKIKNIFNKLNNKEIDYHKDEKKLNNPFTNPTNYKTSLNSEQHDFLSDYDI